MSRRLALRFGWFIVRISILVLCAAVNAGQSHANVGDNGQSGFDTEASDTLTVGRPERPRSSDDAATAGASDGRWSQLPWPAVRSGHTVTYDPIRDRLIVFGGNWETNRNDAWQLAVNGPPEWSELVASGRAPGPRFGHTAIYDPPHDRIIVFGGSGYNDTWELSLSPSPKWTRLWTGGGLPIARYGHTAIYDSARDQMVIFGGYDGSNYLNDVWTLSLGATPEWKRVLIAGDLPVARNRATAVYDPAGDRMILFGGEGDGYRNDTWVLTLGDAPAWTPLSFAGVLPPGRSAHTAVYDADAQQMFVFSGRGSGVGNATWVLDMSATPEWRSLATQGSLPGRREWHGADFDPVRRRMYVFGGYGAGDTNDTWMLTVEADATWAQLMPASPPPPGRWGHTASYSPARDCMVIYGGFASAPRSDVWKLTLGTQPAWSEIIPSGGGPEPRYWHAAIYDPIRDRIVCFGGYSVGGYMNDTWALSLSGVPMWTQLVPTGTPPTARREHVAIYDPAGDRMIILGGYDGGARRNDTWALSMSGTIAWTQLPTTGDVPPGLTGASAAYDSQRGQMVVFGGDAGSYRADTWALSLSGAPVWKRLPVVGGVPVGRRDHAVVYDAARDRLVLFGGRNAVQFELNDTWALNLSGTHAWAALAPAGSSPPIKRSHTAIYDSSGPLLSRGRLVTFGGRNRFDPQDGVRDTDTSALSWAVAALDEPVAKGDAGELPRPQLGEGLALGAPIPNPMKSRSSIRFSLPERSFVELDLFDVTGRHVRSLASGVMEAGIHDATWDRLDDTGHAVSAGTYFLRLTSSHGDQVTERVTIIR